MWKVDMTAAAWGPGLAGSWLKDPAGVVGNTISQLVIEETE